MDSPRSGTQSTTGELAAILGGEITGCRDLVIHGVNSIAEAREGEITFIADARHARAWATSKASAVVVSRGIDLPDPHPDGRAIVLVEHAERPMIALLERFAPPAERPAAGVHPTAIIDPEATLGQDVAIGPYVSIGPSGRIGDRVALFGGVRLYSDVVIGDDSILHANVVVRERCVIGRRVILHSGVSIGSEGFGYRPSGDGRRLLRAPHLGHVVIEDEVEIGANSTVDRGKFGPTVVGEGTKVDNLCQIAHNCRIGRGCVIAAVSGIGGSVTIGDRVQIGGGVTVRDHVTIGEGARIAGRSGVWSDVGPGEAVFGYPAEPHRDMLRQIASLRKLPGWMREVARRLQRLEGE